MRGFCGLALILACSGCGAGATLRQSMDGRRGELHYPPPAAPIAIKDGTTLRVGKVTAVGVLPAATRVKLERYVLIPLLILNAWEERWRCELGRAQIADDPERFLRESLVEEIARGSRHSLSSDPADLEVDVTVTKIEAAAPIDQGLWIFILFNTGTGDGWLRAGPVASSIEAEVVVRKRAEAPRVLQVVGRAQVEVARDEEGRTDLDNVVPALVDGLSAAIQDLNRKIVEAVDAAVAPAPAG